MRTRLGSETKDEKESLSTQDFSSYFELSLVNEPQPRFLWERLKRWKLHFRRISWIQSLEVSERNPERGVKKGKDWSTSSSRSRKNEKPKTSSILKRRGAVTDGDNRWYYCKPTLSHWNGSRRCLCKIAWWCNSVSHQECSLCRVHVFEKGWA